MNILIQFGKLCSQIVSKMCEYNYDEWLHPILEHLNEQWWILKIENVYNAFINSVKTIKSKTIGLEHGTTCVI